LPSNNPQNWLDGRGAEPSVRGLIGWLKRRGYQGPRGPKQLSMKHAVYRLEQRGQESFSLQEIMRDAGLDYYDYSDRMAAKAYISQGREVVFDFIDWLRRDPSYATQVENGYKMHATIFRRCVSVMWSYEIPALYYDLHDKRYHFLTLKAFASIMRQQRDAVKTMILRRSEEIALVSQWFPQFREMFQPSALVTDRRFVLPPRALRHPCNECELRFRDKSSLDVHKEKRHSKPGPPRTNT
jgi:hypothetical protein